jgi:RNA polymerase sigma factor (sigma-70 family)
MRTMAPQRLAGVMTQLRRAIDAPGGAAPTDAELLRRYVAGRDEAAFELLVWRHGAMVLSACRRLVSQPADAEDAFQATFLALVRQAASIGTREAVAGWLHKVACRIANRLRAQAARRSACERQSALAATAGAAGADAIDPLVWAEVRQVLDGEVNRLPAKLRVPFILCYLEGLTNDEAARQLGCPKGTVLSRLARARERLRGRLTRRGLTLSAAALAAALGKEATAIAPAQLVISTVHAALLVAAGKALTGAVSAPVAALTQGVLQAMFMSKVKITLAVVLTVGVVAAGTGRVMYSSAGAGQIVAQAPAQPGKAPAPKPIRERDPAADLLEEARARQAVAAAQLRAAEERVRAADAQLEQAKRQLQQARAQSELAQANYDKAHSDAAAVENVAPAPKKPTTPAAEPQANPQPKQPAAGNAPAKPREPAASTPRQSYPEPQTPLGVDLGKGASLPGGPHSELIQLATSYLDAVRDMQTAKVRLKSATSARDQGAGGADRVEIEAINVGAAQSKVELLRAIIDGALKDAEAETERAQRMQRQGFAAPSQVTAAETKLRVLRLILNSAK